MWNGSYYQIASNEMLRTRIWNFLEHSLRDGGDGGPVPFKPTPQLVNAVVDALSEFGVRHVEMPATPERVWRAIQEAKARR